MIKNKFLLLCFMLMGLASSILYADGNVIKKHRTGWRRPNTKEQAYIAKYVRPFKAVTPNRFALERLSKALSANNNVGLIGVSSSAVINLQYLPPVGNQNEHGSCAAWASCYYVKTWQDAQERGWSDLISNTSHIMSPVFGYNLANGGVDDGSDPSLIMQLMCDHGCATLTDMPANLNPNSSDFMVSNSPDFTSWPSSSVWKNAITYRADTVSTPIDLSSPAGIAALKQVIASGGIAVIGLECYENLQWYPTPDQNDLTVTISSNVYFANLPAETLWEPEDPTNPNSQLVPVNTDEGGHALTVIGYDDNMPYTVTDRFGNTQQEYGAFLLVNQWGTGWGINISTTPHINNYAIDTSTGGFIWMAYSYVMSPDYVQSLNGYVDKEAFVMADRNDYTPTTFGTFSLNHQERGDLDVKFIGGKSNSNPDWSFDCLPNLGGYVPVNQQIYVDLTTYPVNFSNPFWLGVEDSTGAKTGQVTYMSVIEPNGTEMASPNVPVNTVKHSTIYVELNEIALPDIATLNLPGGATVTVDAPAYSFTTPVTITITSTTAPSTTGSNLVFTGVAVDIDSGGNQPAKLVTITIYDNNLPAGINKNRLAIAYYDSSHNRWVALNSNTAPGANEVWCQTSVLSTTFALVELVPSNNLASVKAYPNPYKLNSMSQGITIANLPATAEIKIYDVAGELVRTLNYSTGSGRVVWDGRNDGGNMVASGVYIIYINSPEGTQTLKVGVEK